jgi:acyl-CoA synthetase (NDP forming)
VAVVGASGTSDSLGEWSLTNLRKGGFDGPIYPVNPRYEELQGLRCYAELDDLPEVPDLVVFGVGDARIEAALDDAIAVDVPAAVIMSTLYLDDDTDPPLRDRIGHKINAAGMIVCGANGMGFYNVRDHVWACGFDSGMHEAPGKISLITHSGSGMCGIIDTDRRLRINVAVSSGNELAVTMDEYLDFVLDLPETKVVGLFIETARNPEGFAKALAKANSKQIPVVALKVGRTEESARLAVSHSGAMAGDDATYDALFDRYGVQRVRDMDELATTLIMFAELHPVADGDLVSIHDSGGERQLMVDLADEIGVPLARLGEATTNAIAAIIDPELPAVNPLDGWSRGGPDARQQMTRSLSLMLQDPGAALGVAVLDRGPDGLVYAPYVNYVRQAAADSGKPVALVGSRQGTGDDAVAVSATHEGFPVLDGVPGFLRGAKALFDYRDFLARNDDGAPEVGESTVNYWRSVLQGNDFLSGKEGLDLLQAFGIPVVASRPVASPDQAREVGRALGYPLALKTAVPGIAHKSDVGGVILGIEDDAALEQSYTALEQRLGAEALVAQMAPPGVEMLLGARRDPQFGPVVLIGFGGIHAEVLADVTTLLPPFGVDHALRCIDRLKLRVLLDGARGRAPADIEAFAVTAVRFGCLVHALGDVLEEIDVNPVIVSDAGCTAVDTLLVLRNAR